MTTEYTELTECMPFVMMWLRINPLRGENTETLQMKVSHMKYSKYFINF